MSSLPDPSIAESTSSQDTITPRPGTPASVIMATPVKSPNHPINPTPGHPNNNPVTVALPVTPKNPNPRALLSAREPSTFESLTPASTRAYQVTTSPDSVVFTFSTPETRRAASPVESWENAIVFQEFDAIQSGSPVGSIQTVFPPRLVSTGFRSWVTVSDSLNYDVEQQALMPDSAATAPNQQCDYGTLPRPPSGDRVSLWDCFTEMEMLIICVMLTLFTLILIWTIFDILDNY
ncbi:hypothetical protein F5Y11DRAFT_347630 [Daldinia sp. FL1419]|nr:hypothetical protein F5Y11DRAFT_347630 [Daldinia sp. FL1419]